jgi:hypothetical protein
MILNFDYPKNEEYDILFINKQEKRFEQKPTEPLTSFSLPKEEYGKIVNDFINGKEKDE